MKVVAVTLAFASVFVGVVSCSDTTSPGASGNPTTAPVIPTVDCTTPQQGCACTAGSVVPCGNEVKSDDHFIYCYEGFRTCDAAGFYGECTDGAVTTKSVALSSSELHTLGFGTQAKCGALDPCDPYCNFVTDTPAGLTVPGFILNDGGLKPGAVGAVCGDGNKSGAEACDDGNIANGDGCSSSCQLEPGFKCPTAGMPCVPAVCGNGMVEGLEQCDDGNNRPYDGCSPTCTRDFNCPAGMPCTAVCGDGLKFPGEACDDGNTTDGDGCSASCNVESGATCNTVTAPLPAYIDVPIIYRDFTPTTSPDFEFVGGGLPHPANPTFCTGSVQGIPAIALAADKEPTFGSTQNCVENAASFNQWYRDTTGVNQVILGKSLRLAYNGSGYVFDSANDPAYNLPDINCGNLAGPTTKCSTTYGGFFPINALGYGNYSTYGKNFHFTSEVRYPFTYAGGEVLSFTGDDDVYVFIAGKKVVDLGGFHGALPASVTLNAATNTVPPSTPIGLVVGNTYEIDVFQAERHVTGSNYKLTLQGFNRQVSQCTPPPTASTFVRDFQAVCAPGEIPVWQLFRWQAVVPTGGSIAFRATTSATQGPLPAPAPPASPGSVPIGMATSANSPGFPLAWTNDINAGPPVTPRPVSADLTAVGVQSAQWLRVYMTFNGPPSTLYQWQQLYDCVPAE